MSIYFPAKPGDLNATRAPPRGRSSSLVTGLVGPAPLAVRPLGGRGGCPNDAVRSLLLGGRARARSCRRARACARGGRRPRRGAVEKTRGYNEISRAR